MLPPLKLQKIINVPPMTKILLKKTKTKKKKKKHKNIKTKGGHI
jgi:hypothetical protein